MPLSHPLPRRQALQHLARLATALAGAPSLGAWAQSTSPSELRTNDAALADTWRALSRLGYGPTPGLLREVRAASSPRDWALQQPSLAWKESQLPPVLDEAQEAMQAPLPHIFAGVQRERQARAARKAGADPAPGSNDATPLDLAIAPEPQDYTRSLVAKTAAWRLQACSLPQQENLLLARMTEFWFNHLNVYIGKGAVRPFVGHYLVHAVRAHALGRFEDLLLASARHPAMLHYLDQAQSVANGTRGAQGQTRGLNENYARELMELHTLGVDGGYTQTDVRDLARVLTGWTIDPRSNDGFRFAMRLHDSGGKTVLSHSYPEGLFNRGEAEGEAAIRMLAHQPQTARRLSLRLAQFFVADQPSPTLVQRLSQVFMQAQGEIRPWLQALLQSPEFWDPANRLFKTPMDFACSALAATQGITERRHLPLTLGFLNNAGQPLHGWQTPDGYKTDAATWLVPEALTRRADYALALGRQAPDLDYLLPFLGRATRDTLAQQKPALRAGLLLASPEFMYK